MKFSCVISCLLSATSCICSLLSHTSYEWCKYQLCMDQKTWPEAKAACEAVNKTLLQITDSSHYKDVVELIELSIVQLTRTHSSIESTLWINSAPAGTESTGCYVLHNTTSVSIATDCCDKKQFICKGEGVDCFQEVDSNVRKYLKTYDGGYPSQQDDTISRRCNSECTAFKVGSDRWTPYAAASEVQANRERPNLKFHTKNLLYYDTINIPNSVVATDLCSGSTLTVKDASETAISPMTSRLVNSFTQELSIVSIAIDTTPIQGPKTVIETGTESYISPTPASSYTLTSCTCFNVTNNTMTKEELSLEVQKLREKLLVKKNDLSSWKRKLVSAKDDRMSARGIGYVGVVLLAIISFMIIALDSSRFLTNIKILKTKMLQEKTTSPRIESTLTEESNRQRIMMNRPSIAPTLPGESNRRRIVFLDNASC